MKLDGQEESENVEDRRSMTPVAAGIGGGGAVLLMILGLIFHKDLSMFSGLFGGNGQTTTATQTTPDPEEDQLAHFTKVVFGDTEKVWGEEFMKMGKPYPKPKLVLYRDVTTTACGKGEAAAGPFYCPGDSNVYIDLSFYKLMKERLHAAGDFAHAYVVAHEVGHHVQGLLGYSKIVDDIRAKGDEVETNNASVRLELQADYLAGVWANKANQKFNMLEQGDLETALNAANQIGDDTLQKQAGRTVVRPDSLPTDPALNA